jgi:hypothetical protein
MLSLKTPDGFVQSVETFWQKEILLPFAVSFISQLLERIYKYSSKALVNVSVNKLQLNDL